MSNKIKADLKYPLGTRVVQRHCVCVVRNPDIQYLKNIGLRQVNRFYRCVKHRWAKIPSVTDASAPRFHQCSPNYKYQQLLSFMAV